MKIKIGFANRCYLMLWDARGNFVPETAESFSDCRVNLLIKKKRK